MLRQAYNASQGSSTLKAASSADDDQVDSRSQSYRSRLRKPLTALGDARQRLVDNGDVFAAASLYHPHKPHRQAAALEHRPCSGQKSAVYSAFSGRTVSPVRRLFLETSRQRLIVPGNSYRSRQWVGFKPERASGRKWIYARVPPPREFIAAMMDLTVMRAA